MKKIFQAFFILTFLSKCIYAQQSFPKNGVDENFKPIYAFTNANIIISPNQELKKSTLLIQDNIIIDVDSNLSIPQDAIVYDLEGDYIYPSFIDLYSNYGLEKPTKKSSGYTPQYESNKKGPYNWNQAIHPEIHASYQFTHNKEDLKKYQDMGFGSVLTHVDDGIFRGTGCFVILADNRENQDVIVNKAATFYSFNKGTSSQRYPTSLMGSIALIKQTLLDSEWHEKTNKNSNISLTEYNANKNLAKIFEVKSHLDFGRLFKISDEFEIDYIVKGNGNEFLRLEEIKQTKFPIIVPINFPEDYDVSNLDEALSINLSDLKKWETAPFNPRILHENNITFAITSSGTKNKTEFLKNLKLAVTKGLSKSDALSSLTTIPAKLIGVENKLGTIEKGKIANFLICSSDIFNNGEIYENWAAGKRNIIKKKIKEDIRGYYTFSSAKFNNSLVEIKGQKNKPTVKIHKIDSVNLTTLLKGNTITINDKAGDFKALGYIENEKISGNFLNEDGKTYSFIMQRDSVFDDKKNKKRQSCNSTNTNCLDAQQIVWVKQKTKSKFNTF
ncbi:MAG: amidohydrolase family protein [Flavobacteriales bacterium]